MGVDPVVEVDGLLERLSSLVCSMSRIYDFFSAVYGCRIGRRGRVYTIEEVTEGTGVHEVLILLSLSVDPEVELGVIVVSDLVTVVVLPQLVQVREQISSLQALCFDLRVHIVLEVDVLLKVALAFFLSFEPFVVGKGVLEEVEESDAGCMGCLDIFFT